MAERKLPPSQHLVAAAPSPSPSPSPSKPPSEPDFVTRSETIDRPVPAAPREEQPAEAASTPRVQLDEDALVAGRPLEVSVARLRHAPVVLEVQGGGTRRRYFFDAGAPLRFDLGAPGTYTVILEQDHGTPDAPDYVQVARRSFDVRDVA